MATFLELQNRVLGNLIDTPDRVQDRVDDFINNAMKELQDRHNFDLMKDEEAYVTTVTSHTLGTVPTNWKEYRGRPYYIDNTSGRIVKLTVVQDKRGAMDMVTDQRTDRPRYIIRGEINELTGTSSFLVFPVPNGLSDYSGGEYRITVPYWRYLAALSADGDHNVLTDDSKMAQFVEERATSEGFGVDWDEAREDKWLLKSERSWKMLKKRFNQSVLAGVDTLVPHQGADWPEIAE